MLCGQVQPRSFKLVQPYSVPISLFDIVISSGTEMKNWAARVCMANRFASHVRNRRIMILIGGAHLPLPPSLRPFL